MDIEIKEHESIIAYHVSEATDHINDAINESRNEGFAAGGREALEVCGGVSAPASRCGPWVSPVQAAKSVRRRFHAAHGGVHRC